MMTWSCAAVLGCRDVRAAVEHYSTTLGFDFDPAWGVLEGVDEDEGPVYAIGTRSGLAVHLQIRRRPTDSEREDIETDLFVYVDDVDALYEEYLAKGVTIHRPICDEEYGMRDFCIVDPEGHRLAFGSPTPSPA